MMNIDAQIQNRRSLLRITQEDLAEISGVSLRTIKTIEKGQGNPTVKVLEKLLGVMGLRLNVVEKVDHE